MGRERRIINPWKWQDNFGFVQANETSGGQRVLYCAGQASMDTDGRPVHPGTCALSSTKQLTISKRC